LDHAEAHSEGTTEGQLAQGGEEEVTVNAMTAAAFKNWLDGYMEGRGGRLTQKDIKRIQAQAASVSEGCGCYHPYPYSPWTFTTTPTIFTGTTCVGNQDNTDITDYSMPATTFQLSSTGNSGFALDTTSMCSG